MKKIFDHQSGEVRELDDDDAHELVKTGRATYAEEALASEQQPPKRKTKG